jgi:hypothetical protein
MKGNKHMKTKLNIIYPAFALFALAYSTLSPQAQAVCQQGCDLANNNTFLGDNALINNTTGSHNTATGRNALHSNITGSWNTANGELALISNTTGDFNTAFGQDALSHNTSGGANVATGSSALALNTEGDWNTADGTDTLVFNTTGRLNTAVGANALHNHTTGTLNVALGWAAGDLTTSDNNIVIGNIGAAADLNTIRIGAQTAVTDEFGVIHPAHRGTFIAGISGTAIIGRPVMINANGRLGTVPSSARYKDEIKPMDAASEVILALKPVTFRYKKEIDADRTPQFGLIAEDVEKVNPALVARDEQGKPYTVRYEAVNAMLLNEFLKEHRQVQEQEATIAELKSIAAKQEMINAQQQREVKALAATLREQASQIQKVSAQLELEKASAQAVVNNR